MNNGNSVDRLSIFVSKIPKINGGIKFIKHLSTRRRNVMIIDGVAFASPITGSFYKIHDINDTGINNTTIQTASTKFINNT